MLTSSGPVPPGREGVEFGLGDVGVVVESPAQVLGPARGAGQPPFKPLGFAQRCRAGVLGLFQLHLEVVSQTDEVVTFAAQGVELVV